jgi:hypothetical protein
MSGLIKACSVVWMGAFLVLSGMAQSTEGSGIVLARVEVGEPMKTYPLPVHAVMQEPSGTNYLLVFNTAEHLALAGRPWRELDRDARPEQFITATVRRPGAREAALARFVPLLDDGRHWVLRATPEAAGELAELGFDVRRMTASPMEPARTVNVLLPSGRTKSLGDSFAANPLVSTMIQRVDSTNLFWQLRRLTGEDLVVVAGGPQKIPTRHTTAIEPLGRALSRVADRLSAPGLDVTMAAWSVSSYHSSNVVATLPGRTLSNELVLITAHLDDMPSGNRAPGVDDNGSGCAAVLAAASVLSQYRFDRTIQFVLFTGEEQGLYGSYDYAMQAAANGDNIVAVLNLDMISWCASPQKVVRIHTRVARGEATNDTVIASVITNVVNVYGLTNQLRPVITADNESASDHSSFWALGYPAVLVIEDDYNDFDPYYHTTNDVLSHVNMPYLTANVQAVVAAAAHLAGPVSGIASDGVELVNSDWIPGSGIGARVFRARHLPGATETGPDPWDIAVTNAPGNPNPTWFEVSTKPYGVALVTDSRPTNSESIFSTRFMVEPAGAIVTGSGQALEFDFTTAPLPDRLYTARIEVSASGSSDPEGFLCYTNLRSVITAGGTLALPDLANVHGETVFGTCDIAMRQLETNAASCPLRLVSANGSALQVVTAAQVGCRIVDAFETCTNLAGGTWTGMGSFTNDVMPDATSFTNGWKTIARTLDLGASPAASRRFIRFNRSWQVR